MDGAPCRPVPVFVCMYAMHVNMPISFFCIGLFPFSVLVVLSVSCFVHRRLDWIGLDWMM
uniref:Transmembrane protein n=1 Tax=Arundo donax TaxID=35708 RepID=A0A0A9E6L1_ARUDO